MEHLSVLLVDDHPLFADAMQIRLSDEPDLLPVRAVYSAAQVRRALAAQRFDVVVLDFVLEDEVATSLIGEIKQTQDPPAVLVLSGSRDVDAIVDAVQQGADGWLAKSANVARLIDAVRGVHAGEIWLEPALLGKVLPTLIRRLSGQESGPFDQLTAREREVLDCMARGMSRAEIGEHLQLARNTVRTHTHNLIRKLGVHSSLEAVAIALRNGAG